MPNRDSGSPSLLVGEGVGGWGAFLSAVQR